MSNIRCLSKDDLETYFKLCDKFQLQGQLKNQTLDVASNLGTLAPIHFYNSNIDESSSYDDLNKKITDDSKANQLMIYNLYASIYE